MYTIYKFFVMNYFFLLEFDDLIICQITLLNFLTIIFYLLLDGVKDIFSAIKFEYITIFLSTCIEFYIRKLWLFDKIIYKLRNKFSL